MRKQVFLYDCFGTVLLENKGTHCSWNDAVGDFLKIDAALVKQLRRSAEITVSGRSVIGEYSFADMLQNFYQRYEAVMQYKSDKDFSKFSELAYRTEIEDLSKKTRLNTKLVKEILLNRSKGCKTILLSDFYLGKTILFDLIDSKSNLGGELFDDLMVSCDINANKSSGSSYSYLKDTLGFDPSVCHMTGDNFRADFINAITRGISAKWYR